MKHTLRSPSPLPLSLFPPRSQLADTMAKQVTDFRRPPQVARARVEGAQAGDMGRLGPERHGGATRRHVSPPSLRAARRAVPESRAARSDAGGPVQHVHTTPAVTDGRICKDRDEPGQARVRPRAGPSSAASAPAARNEAALRWRAKPREESRGLESRRAGSRLRVVPTPSRQRPLNRINLLPDSPPPSVLSLELPVPLERVEGPPPAVLQAPCGGVCMSRPCSVREA